MRLTRVYLNSPLQPGTIVDLSDEQHHYLTRVLRLTEGSEVALFNGEAAEFRARLTDVQKRRSAVHIEQRIDINAESPLRITLYQGISKGDRMDFAVQKSTELGVDRIVPVQSEYGAVRLTGERAEKRQQHWQHIAVSAAQQSGRTRVPEVAAVVSLDDLPPMDAVQPAMVFHPDGITFDQLSPPGKAAAAAVAIGPEGGWSARDLVQLEAAGFVRVRCGPRILRTETAAATALTLLQWAWGDLRR